MRGLRLALLMAALHRQSGWTIIAALTAALGAEWLARRLREGMVI